MMLNSPTNKRVAGQSWPRRAEGCAQPHVYAYTRGYIHVWVGECSCGQAAVNQWARGRDVLEGKGPQRRPQRRLDRRLEAVAKALEGGYCRFQCIPWYGLLQGPLGPRTDGSAAQSDGRNVEPLRLSMTGMEAFATGAPRMSPLPPFITPPPPIFGGHCNMQHRSHTGTGPQCVAALAPSSRCKVEARLRLF